MNARQSERQDGSGDRVHLLGRGEGQNSGNEELIYGDFGDRDFAFGTVRNVFVPVG